jgi:hypothetical protein
MAEEKAKEKQSPFIEVTLIDTHTHQGVPYQKGETITIRRRQLQQLREWGKVK